MVTADATAAVPTDEELGARFSAGDPAAVTDLYVRWSGQILDYVSGIVRDRATAEDVTQATFVRAIEARATLRDPTKIRGWLFTIARNLALKHLKRSRRHSTGDLELLGVAAQDASEDEVLDRATTALVWKAAASLDERQYTVLTLMLRHGCTASEIADVLGVSTNHAYQLENRAKGAIGSAIRTLLLANSQHDCARLTTLLPDDVTTLTPGQHRSIEHHLRRCSGCTSKVLTVTAASALFTGIPLLVLPERLRDPHVLQAAAAGARLHASRRFWPALPALPLLPLGLRRPRPPVALGLGIALLLLTIVPLTLHFRAPQQAPSHAGSLATPGASAHPPATPLPSASLTPAGAMVASRAAIANASSYQLSSSGLPLGGLDDLR